jgi:cobalt-zinc-cadmium efflux system protein
VDVAHDHAHEHDHHGAAQGNRRRLWVVLLVALAVMLAEVVGGLVANSLVLLADAAHYATDVLAVGLALFAMGVAARPADESRTFGYRRAEVLAAFANAAALWGVSAWLLFEAWRRLRAPEEVGGVTVMVVGGFTLVANGGLALLLARASGRNLNVRAAYAHLLSDVGGSAAAVIAGALVAFAGWRAADPLLTLLVTALILVFAWRLARETLHILLEGAPVHLDVAEIRRAIAEVARVQEVHELHVWSLADGHEVLSVHVVLDAPPADDHVTHDIHERLREKFRIDHVTVQVESPGCPCEMSRCLPDGAAGSARA